VAEVGVQFKPRDRLLVVGSVEAGRGCLQGRIGKWKLEKGNWKSGIRDVVIVRTRAHRSRFRAR
jgi:hypothetical protein